MAITNFVRDCPLPTVTFNSTWIGCAFVALASAAKPVEFSWIRSLPLLPILSEYDPAPNKTVFSTVTVVLPFFTLVC